MPSKFFNNLISKDASLANRASSVEVKARNAQSKIIQNLQDKIEDLKLRIADLCDLGPDESTSLRPVDRNWDANAWVDALQSTKIQLYNAQVNLKLAVDTYNELFTEESTKDNEPAV